MWKNTTFVLHGMMFSLSSRLVLSSSQRLMEGAGGRPSTTTQPSWQNQKRGTTHFKLFDFTKASHSTKNVKLRTLDWNLRLNLAKHRLRSLARNLNFSWNPCFRPHCNLAFSIMFTSDLLEISFGSLAGPIYQVLHSCESKLTISIQHFLQVFKHLQTHLTCGGTRLIPLFRVEATSHWPRPSS